MIKILVRQYFKPKHILYLAKVLLLCFIFCSALIPVYAAPSSSLNSQLETQVLQIIRDHPEVIIESLQAYQKQQYELQKQKQQAALQQLKNKPQLLIGNSPIIPASAQKVLLIEFSDFQCPYCAKMSSTLKQFVSKHSEEITFIYKHFPLIQIHDQALPAASSAWAAYQQGQFWPFHDRLFSQQDKLGEELYLDIAKELNLDLEQFNRDRNSEVANRAIQEDMAIAQQLGLDGTPFIVIYDTTKPSGKIEALSGALQISDLEAALVRIQVTSFK